MALLRDNLLANNVSKSISRKFYFIQTSLFPYYIMLFLEQPDNSYVKGDNRITRHLENLVFT